jgi:hypothetical protein
MCLLRHVHCGATLPTRASSYTLPSQTDQWQHHRGRCLQRLHLERVASSTLQAMSNEMIKLPSLQPSCSAASRKTFPSWNLQVLKALDALPLGLFIQLNEESRESYRPAGNASA